MPPTTSAYPNDCRQRRWTSLRKEKNILLSMQDRWDWKLNERDADLILLNIKI